MKQIFRILSDIGYPISEEVQSYYNDIDMWKCWWKGFYPSFHKYVVKTDNGLHRTLKRKQMRMAKKVCEDWASLLLNDKTRIIVEGDDVAQSLLTGDDNEQSGGVLGTSKFWKIGNRAVERAFAQGTVCFYIQLTGATVINDSYLKADGLKIKVIKDAEKIIPLSYEDDDIHSIALASTKVKRGKKIMYIQTFEPDGEEYVVTNYWYEINGESYMPIEAPNGEVKSYMLPCKPFFILRPNIENNIADVPLGMSVYANAIDNLQSCDLGFDNLFSDVLLGKKRVFMNQALVSMLPVTAIDADTGEKKVVNIEPNIDDTLEKSLYVTTGEKLMGDQQFFQEYNPALRIDENKSNIQFNLNLLSSKVGLGQRRYSFDSTTMNTATEVKVSNKDQTESIWKQRIEIQEVLTDLTRSILIIAKEKCGANVDTEAKITIQFDDTMFNDEEAERMRFLQEISQGVRMKWEYRVKYLGESEEEAKKITGEDEEKKKKTIEDEFFTDDEEGLN